MFDCVVVGAGSFGAWSALKLRQAGRTVALVEAFHPGHAKASSGGASRIIRMGYGADEIYTRWSLRSLEAWKDLFHREGASQLFQQTGVLWTALPGHPHAQGTLAALRTCGVPHEHLTAGEIARRYPALHFRQEVTGIWEPESGALLANQAVGVVVDAAIRAGVQFLPGRIAPPAENGALGFLAMEDGRRIAAGEFVFACGPWLPLLFPEAVGPRIRVTRQPLFYFDAAPEEFPVWIDFSDPRGGYSIPPVGGKRFKLGLDRHGSEFDPDTGSRAVTPAETAAVREFLAERFPALAHAAIVETEVCQYENTSSGDFLLDRHPTVPNVWLVGGGSGHGFKHGPAVGEYVAALLHGATPDARFAWSAKSKLHARAVY